MKKFKVLSIVLIFAFIFGLNVPVPARAATNPSLGAASSFAILAQTAITGISTIIGDVGMNNNGASISALLPANVTGTIYSTDGVAPSTAIINPAVQADASTAYTTTIPGLPVEGAPIVVSELSGISRGPGVYDLPAGAVTLTGGTLTLDGPGTYIFRITTGLTSSGSINFINGARACDLFWNVGSLATINGTSFAGTILAGTGVHFGSGVALDGRALAVGGDVTLGVDGTISGPSCAAPASTATLTLVKTVVNDNGGIKTVTDFPLTATGATTITGVSGTASVTAQVVDTGVYTLSETAQTGYLAGSWSCTNGIVVNGSNEITLGSGDVTTCTIVNDDVAPQLIVTKIVVNDSGGNKVIADFPLFVDAVSVLSGVSNATTIGLHTVTETSQSGYVASVFGGDCAANGTITLALGDIKTCTITNDDVPPSGGGGSGGSYTSAVPPLIDVVKVPSPLALPAGPGPVTYTYTLSNIGTVPVSDITMVGDSCNPIIFESGDTNSDFRLDVTETWVYKCSTTLSKTHTNIVTTIGWANGISAIDIASATVVVGIPGLPDTGIFPPLIHVTKVPNPLALFTGPGMVTYTQKITNPGTVALSNIRLTDDKCAPMRYVYGDVNNNSKLETTETWTYTCQSRLTKTTTNTVSASGDANGLTARDFAIATVVVTYVPGLPKTGFGPEDNISWNIIISAGILGLLTYFYLARKKQTS